MFGWVMLVLVILEHIYHVIIIILIIMSLCDYHYLDYHVIIIKGDVGARHTGTYLSIQKTKRQKFKRTKRPKREFHIVMSGQFRALAMFITGVD